MFSVVIPIYNAESTLNRCLDSLIKQEFKDFEVIMINDGSEDDSEQICLHYTECDERFRYYVQKNKGVSAARNLGIDYANGEFVTFLDSDDVYYENYLQCFYEVISKFPGKIHYWCGYGYISNVEGRNGKKIKYGLDDELICCRRKNFMALHEMELVAPSFNKVYNKKILNEFHVRMKDGLSLGEDLIFNLEYLDCCDDEIIICNKINYGYYCDSTNSLNNRYRKDLQEIYNLLIGKIYQYLIKWGAWKEQEISFYNMVFYMYDRVLRNTFHESNELHFIKKIKYNNAIMRSDEFRESLKQSKVSVNKIYKSMYYFKRYELMLLMDSVLSLIKSR